MMDEKMLKKRYGLFALAVLLLAFACAAFVLAPNNFAIRLLGIAAIVVSVWLVRRSGIHTQSRGLVSSGGTTARAGSRLGIVGWAAGVGSLLAAGASYFYLRNDALHGYHQVSPVYVFAGVGLACAVIWGYIAVKLLQ